MKRTISLEQMHALSGLHRMVAEHLVATGAWKLTETDRAGLPDTGRPETPAPEPADALPAR